ncbi:phosphotransferase family protein [Oceanirhabdus seepicola]|uniref:Aminoglycoside phosphotransferase family protein n=1 Tax=Oceanirhabdus seepicola TaxID=2828781 RepID=A0A9J6NW40_9CLOT|nr:aminoglycoside phosphotransferase family protein [Oceanirhabdus seepicola]MCM1988222.1 aminoglycoside phosphotransferase family protein [Oceanirhabdus seepicola]
MLNIKPEINIVQVDNLLEKYFGSKVQGLQAVVEGNLKQVYLFNHSDKYYVIRFSKRKEEFEVERFLYEKFEHQGLSIPKILEIGSLQNTFFSISEQAIGKTINTLSANELYVIMPNLIESITKMHSVDLGNYKGYGWINPSGNGLYDSWYEYLVAFFKKDQDGFWKDWYDLFENSFLEYDVFQELYEKMLQLSQYCESERYLIHGDCHFGNIISDTNKVTGIIDWGNVMYGDYIFDIATLHMQFQSPKYNLLKMFEEYYEAKGINVPNFRERFLCATYCKGLDSLRFFTKLGRKKSYDSVKDYLISLDI